MKVLRTPDSAFAAIDDFPFAPNYVEIADPSDGTPLRVHYVDEGPRDAPVVLMMHGEPSWSYLYRHMIGPVVAAGFRVVAPDLIGFGKSDKPTKKKDYSYARHVGWMRQWIEGLDLSNMTLVCQDWGSLIGLRLVAAFPDRFARLVISNTYLPVGENIGPGFDGWRAFSQATPEFKSGRIVDGGCNRALTSAEIAAYDAPFPDEGFKAGARQFPVLVPVTPDHLSVAENVAAWAQLERFDKPVLTCFGNQDKVLGHLDTEIQRRIPGAKGQPHCRIDASHFCQEDQPEQLVALIHNFIAA